MWSINNSVIFLHSFDFYLQQYVNFEMFIRPSSFKKNIVLQQGPEIDEHDEWINRWINKCTEGIENWETTRYHCYF